MAFEQKEHYTVDDLLAIMRLLRSPGGCPWDREQTHHSIRKNFLEETYEVAEAIDKEDADLLREELGDVLLQVVFHTEMERERGAFDFDDVCDGICKKLIVRHPHIFGDVTANTTGEVLDNWEAIKRREKRQQTYTETLESVPRTLPALMRSEKVQQRAARSGFDYRDVAGAMRDLCSEVEELRQAVDSGTPEEIDGELGDVLFSAVNVARFLRVDSEQSLTRSCDKFISRYAAVEQLARERGIQMETSGLELLDNLWREAKIKEH